MSPGCAHESDSNATFFSFSKAVINMDLVETAVVVALAIKNRRKRRKIEYWVHPLWSDRLTLGKFHTMFMKLRAYPKKFFRYFRMSVESFDELCRILRPGLVHEDTNMRLAVSPEERLAVTLRYLATGASFYSLSFDYLLGVTTVREIVKSTCTQIWIRMHHLYMPQKSEEDWLIIARQFYERTDFPNIIGAIDGKHIRLIQSAGSGSECFNYKKYFSIVLMAWVDADYKFVYIDVGAIGAAGDASVFQNSKVGKRLQQNLLNIPDDKSLPNDDNGKLMPFCLVADEAFGLSRNILRPFSRKSLTVIKKIYNYRHSRARRMVECTFGILANKWRIFHRPLDVNLEFCDIIVKSACVLHNYVRCRDGIRFADTAYDCPLQSVSANRADIRITAPNIRNYLASYFTSARGSVPWQYNKI